jgi:hypothetical protein
MSTTRERWIALCAEQSRAGTPAIVKHLANVVSDFAESEVALALAPREQSPELAEAEMWLRESSQWFREHGCPIDAGAVISDELDRRAAEIARLTAIVEHCRERASPTKEPTP